MGFLQSDLTPSTAPFRPQSAGQAMTRIPALRKPLGYVLVALIAAVLFAIPGYAAARATDSIAIGIMAADFTFLIAVAVLSTVPSRAGR